MEKEIRAWLDRVAVGEYGAPLTEIMGGRKAYVAERIALVALLYTCLNYSQIQRTLACSKGFVIHAAHYKKHYPNHVPHAETLAHNLINTYKKDLQNIINNPPTTLSQKQEIVQNININPSKPLPLQKQEIAVALTQILTQNIQKTIEIVQNPKNHSTLTFLIAKLLTTKSPHIQLKTLSLLLDRIAGKPTDVHETTLNAAPPKIVFQLDTADTEESAVSLEIIES